MDKKTQFIVAVESYQSDVRKHGCVIL
jgi:hypothetical protein